MGPGHIAGFKRDENVDRNRWSNAGWQAGRQFHIEGVHDADHAMDTVFFLKNALADTCDGYERFGLAHIERHYQKGFG